MIPEQEARNGRSQSCVKVLRSLVMGSALLCSFIHVWTASADIIKLETFSSHSRLSFPSLQKKPMVVKVDGKSFEITLTDISLTDWGVAFGEEKQFIQEVLNKSDHRLSNVKISEESGNLVLRGEWNFPTGLDAPARPKMETYHYVQDSKARAHFDFWLQSGKTVREANAEAQRNREIQNKKRAEAEAQKRLSRRLARAKSKNQIENLGDFCTQPLSESNHLPIHFRPLKEPIDFAQWFPRYRPDEGFTYSDPAGSKEEIAYIQLARRLEIEGKFALVVKTIDFLFRDFPRTKLKDEMLLLKASALFKLGLVTESDSVLNELSSSPSRSIAVHQAMLYQANKALEKSSPLSTFELFSKLQNRFPESDLVWVFRLGIAESLAELKQTERASTEYEWLTKHSKRNDIKAIASFRLGDLFLERREYSKAIGRYYQSFKDFPELAKQTVSARLNYSEALFWSSQHDRAEEEFVKVINEYGSNPYGWRATIRLAEIKGYKSDLVGLKNSYIETINRYPNSLGSRIAQMALVPCGDRLGLSVEGVARLIENSKPLLKDDSEIDYVEFEKFYAFQTMRVVALTSDPEEIFKIAYQQREGTLPQIHKEFIDRAISAAFKKGMQDEISKNSVMNTIRFFEKYRSKAQESLVRSDSNQDYLIQIAANAASAGLLNSAYEIVYFKDQLDRRLSRNVAQKNIDLDVDQEIEQSEINFISAKILWLKNGIKNKKEIELKLSKIIDASSYSAGRETLMGLIAEKEGKTVTALKHALRAETLLSSETRNDEKYGYLSWIYQLQRKNNNHLGALGVLKQLEQEMSDNATRKVNTLSDVFVLPRVPQGKSYWYERAELESRLSRWSDAASSFSKIIKLDPSDDRAHVQFVRAQYRSGNNDSDGKLAETLREIIKSGKDEVWKKVASEVLKTRELKSNAKEGKS